MSLRNCTISGAANKTMTDHVYGSPSSRIRLSRRSVNIPQGRVSSIALRVPKQVGLACHSATRLTAFLLKGINQSCSACNANRFECLLRQGEICLDLS